MEKNMEKRIALVTGGTGGIGTAICRELYTKGIIVVASYYKEGNHELARLWQQQQQRDGYDILINYANVAKFADCELLVNQIVEQFGRLDILINNAGITADSSLKKMTLQQWNET